MLFQVSSAFPQPWDASAVEPVTTNLLPDNTSSTPSVQSSADTDDKSIGTDSYSDQLIDDLVYQSYLSAQHAYELDLLCCLEPEDTIQFTYVDANENLDNPVTGDILVLHQHVHSRQAYPLPRCQTRAQRDPSYAPASGKVPPIKAVTLPNPGEAPKPPQPPVPMEDGEARPLGPPDPQPHPMDHI